MEMKRKVVSCQADNMTVVVYLMKDGDIHYKKLNSLERNILLNVLQRWTEDLPETPPRNGKH